MKLYKYTGETATEALRIAQEKHGEDALVVKNEEKQKKTLTQPSLYEITVAVDEDDSPAPAASAPAPEPKRSTGR